MSTVKNLTQKVLTIGVAVVTVLSSFAGVIAPLAAQAVDASCPAGVVAGAMIQVTSPKKQPAVYMLDNGMHYRYFESGDVFKSWESAENYAGIVGIPQSCFDSLSQPAQAPYHISWRPGSYVVKYLSQDQLYSVEPNMVLAPMSVDAAKALYGANYKVQTIGLSEWPYYQKTGAALDGSKVAPGMLVSNGGKTWYVADANTIREVTSAGMTGNGFKAKFVHPVSSAMVAGFTTGNQITAAEPALSDRLMQGGVTPGPVVSGGNLTVSLAADNPAGGLLASGTSFNPVLKVNLTAGSQDVSVTGITVTKSGYAANTAVSGLDVVDSAGVRHGNVVTSIGTDNTASLLFASTPVVVKAGSTETLTVRANISGTTGSVQFSLANASAVTSNGTAGGSFPVTGNLFSLTDGSNALASATVNEAAINASGATYNVDATNEQEIAKFAIAQANSNEGVNLSKLTLYNNGTAADTDVQDVQLVSQEGNVLATAQQVNKNVVFSLATPYFIDKGLTKNFTVRAKVVSGAGRTVQFVIYNNYDVVLTGATTNANILPTTTSGGTSGSDTNFPVGNKTNYNLVTIGSGSISFNKDVSSPSSALVPGQTNTVLAAYFAKPTGEDMELRQVQMYITTSTTGVLTGSVVVKVNGASVYSAAPTTISGSSGSPSTITLSTYPTLKAGTNNMITVEGNISSSAAGAATVKVNLDLTQVKRLITNDITDPGVSSVAGNQLTVQAAALKVTTLATPVAQSIVTGASGVELANFQLNAGSVSAGEDVKVTKVIVSDTVASGAVVSDMSNLNLYQKNSDGTLTQLAITGSTATGAASNTFSFSAPLVVPKTGSVILVLKGDLTGSNSGTHTFAILNTGDVSAVGATTGNTVTPTLGSGSGQAMTVASAGTLTVSLVSGGSGAPSNDQIVNIASANNSVLGFKLTAQKEAVKLTSLTITATGTALSSNDITNIRLYRNAETTPFATMPAMTCASNVCTSTSTATDNLLADAVQPGAPVTIYVKADVGNTGVAKLGDSFRFSVAAAGDIVGKGVGSGSSINSTGSAVPTAFTYITPFTVSVTGDAPTAGSSVTQSVLPGSQIARIKVMNNGSSQITVTNIKFTTSTATTGNTTTYKLMASDQNSNNYTANTAKSALTDSVNFTGMTTTIDGGSYRYFTVVIGSLGSSVTGDAYQLSIASIGDVQYSATETNLGYDGNADGDMADTISSLYADGKPSLGTIVKQ